MQTKSKIILALIVAVLAVAAGAKLLAKNVLPDSTQIQNELSNAAASASSKDASAVMSIISSSYTDADSNTTDRLNLLLHQQMSNVRDLSVDISATAIKIVGDTAVSTSQVTITADGQVVFDQLVELDWRKEATRRYLIIPDQGWRVVHSNYTGSLDGS